MEKGTLIKLAVVFIILVFVIEMLYMWSRGAVKTTTVEGITGSGSVQTNATIADYERALTVVGYDPLLEEAKNNLTKAGLITYAVPLDENTTVYNIADGVSAGEVASALEGLNVSLYSKAYIILPPFVNVTMDNGTTALIPASPIQEDMDPTFLAGDTILIRFNVYIANSQISRYGGVEIIPRPATIPATARVLNITSVTYSLSIPWEQRGINRSALTEEFRPLNASFSYKGQSFINANLTQEQVSAIKALNLSYVAAVSPTTISIQTNFTDRSAALSDLSNFSDLLSFPNSTITLDFEGAVGEEIEGNISSVMEGYNLSYGMARSETLLLELPRTIAADKNYTIKGDNTRAAILSGLHELNETLNATIDAKVISNRIMRIDQVKIS